MSQKILMAMLMASCVVIGVMWGQLKSTPLIAESVGDDHGFPFQLVNVQDLSSASDSDILNGQFMVFNKDTGELSFLDASIKDTIRPMDDSYSIIRDDKGGAFVLNKRMGAAWKLGRVGINTKLKLLPFIAEE